MPLRLTPTQAARSPRAPLSEGHSTDSDEVFDRPAPMDIDYETRSIGKRYAYRTPASTPQQPLVDSDTLDDASMTVNAIPEQIALLDQLEGTSPSGRADPAALCRAPFHPNLSPRR